MTKRTRAAVEKEQLLTILRDLLVLATSRCIEGGEKPQNRPTIVAARALLARLEHRA